MFDKEFVFSLLFAFIMTPNAIKREAWVSHAVYFLAAVVQLRTSLL